MTEHPTARTPAEAVKILATALKSIDRSTNPIAWATTAYRLGMATAEQPSANPQQNLNDALALYDKAGQILTAERAPVEHGRILNVAGSAHRMLGDPTSAARLFGDAHDLLAGRGVVVEQAAVLNNLGLVRSEQGQLDGAIEAFTSSLQLLSPADDSTADDSTADDSTVDDSTADDSTADDSTADHSTADGRIRTEIATRHNLGQVHLARGDVAGCDAAIAILTEASSLARTIDASMHGAMVDHTLGVCWKAKAAIDSSDADSHLAQAVDAFERSLAVFTSVGFPMQHAIAKHNLGHAHAGRDDMASLQRALVYYEDAMNIFDPRLHRLQWNEAATNANAVEARLRTMAPDASRPDHTATLVGTMDEPERLAFLRQRFAQMERLPESHRLERLTEFAHAVVNQPAASFVATIRTTITVLMELPDSLLESALRGQIQAHEMLDPHDQRAADFILDEAINLLLFGPQRIRVRDLLAEIGWDRP